MNDDNELSARDLKLLDLIYTTHSVSKAAEILGQAQPTVSSWLRRIRERVGDPLFVRTSDGMRPTPRADFAVGKAREILAAMHQITAGVARFEPASSARVFRVCVPDAAQITLLPSMLRALRKGAPNVRIEAGFYQQALFEQDFVCLVSRAHPRIGDDLTLADFQREAHIAVGYGSTNAVIESELKRQNVKRRVLASVQGVLGVAKIVAATDMLTTLPGQIAATLAEGGSVRLLPCPVTLPAIVVKQYWHSRFHHDPGNQWLRSICASEARSSLRLSPWVRDHAH